MRPGISGKRCRAFTTVLLATAALTAVPSAGTALADDAGESPATEAGTTFLSAMPISQGQEAKASASTGDYLYWAFPADAGQTVTAKATVTLPPSSARHGSATWTLDAFDGLRRRQACASGKGTRSAATQESSVDLSCKLRKVRSWAEPWANDPLPGTYYLRLTVVNLPDQDLGLPVQVDVQVSARDGDAEPEDGKLDAALNPVSGGGATQQPGATASPTSETPSTAASESDTTVATVDNDDGFFSGWSTRWLWTISLSLIHI